jgi:hypothetical protein
MGLAFGVFLVLARLMVANAAIMLRLAFGLIDGSLAFVTGWQVADCLSAAIRLAALLGIPFLIYWLIVERGRRPSSAFKVYFALLRLLLRSSIQLGKVAFKFLRRTVRGPDREPARRQGDPR